MLCLEPLLPLLCCCFKRVEVAWDGCSWTGRHKEDTKSTTNHVICWGWAQMTLKKKKTQVIWAHPQQIMWVMVDFVFFLASVSASSTTTTTKMIMMINGKLSWFFFPSKFYLFFDIATTITSTISMMTTATMTTHQQLQSTPSHSTAMVATEATAAWDATCLELLVCYYFILFYYYIQFF